MGHRGSTSFPPVERIRSSIPDAAWVAQALSGWGWLRAPCVPGLAEACDQHPASTTATPTNLPAREPPDNPTDKTPEFAIRARILTFPDRHNGGQILVLPHNILAQVSRPPDRSHVRSGGDANARTAASWSRSVRLLCLPFQARSRLYTT